MNFYSISALLFVTASLVVCDSAVMAQDNGTQSYVVFSDMTIARGATIESFDVDGVRIKGLESTVENSNERTWLWSEVHSASLSGERLAEFQRFRKEIGLPLSRITQRMTMGDHANLRPFIEQLSGPLAGRTGDATYLMHAADMLDRLHRGDRPSATIPLIHLLSLRAIQPELSRRDSTTGLSFDSSSGVCEQLIPIWFDPKSLEPVIEHLAALLGEDSSARTDTGLLYLAMQLACLGDRRCSDVMTVLQQGDQSRWEAWSTVMTMAYDCAREEYSKVIQATQFESLPAQSLEHASGLYFDGIARARAAENPSDATLTLLQIPASYGRQYPELSAAAIFSVIEHQLAGETSYESIEQELIQVYANTFYGKRFSENLNGRSGR